MPRGHGQVARVVRHALTDAGIGALLIAAFALVNLVGLDRMPLVNLDEPWIAEPGLRFWQTGVFASELHRGFYGVERHFLLHAPLFSILAGGSIALFGPGLFQVRIVSLALATATAALTFALGRRLLSARHGLFAVLILTTWQISPGLPTAPTGIPLVDLGRLARYDIAVPVFCVTALLLVLPLLTSPRTRVRSSAPAAEPVGVVRFVRGRLLLAGVCIGLGVTCHPAGLAWVAIVCGALLVARGRDGLPLAGWVIGGTLAGLLPYAWWVWTGWTDFLLQQRYVSDRYDLFSPRFYVENVLQEWRRYGRIGRGLLAAQPGAWLIAMCGLVGLWTLWRGDDRRDTGGRVLRLGLVTGAGLFALGLKPKLYHYLATLWPLLALTAAVGVVTLLRARVRIVRAATIVMMVVAAGDGLRGWNRVTFGASSVTAYQVLCEQLATRIPPDSRVLALPYYWFGLAPRVREYRSFFGPMLFASPRFASEHEPLGVMLADAGANVVVLDRAMLTFLDRAFDPASPAHEYVIPATGLRDYLAQRSERHVGFDDPSYGRFEIHYLRPSRAPGTTPP